MSDEEGEGGDSPREQLLKSHRKERKELQAQIQALKKVASKGDKKKKKELVDTVAKLEQELADKHKAELDSFDAASLASGVTALNVNATESRENGAASLGAGEMEGEEVEEAEKALGPLGIKQEKQSDRLSKAQKRRDKKADREKEREQEIRLQEEENRHGVRHLEQEAIKQRLADRGLTLKEIPSDGDCMFAGLVHQLQQRGIQSTVQVLRQDTAKELTRRKDEYLPFLTNSKTGDMLTEAEFEAYCEAMAGTPAWGGQVELRALACVLQLPIQVVQAEGPNVVVGAEEHPGAEPLVLTYHRHAYGLGAHYNSVQPKV